MGSIQRHVPLQNYTENGFLDYLCSFPCRAHGSLRHGDDFSFVREKLASCSYEFLCECSFGRALSIPVVFLVLR